LVHDPASGWLRTPHPSLGLIAEAFIIFGSIGKTGQYM
jgi:hypothetical protein